MNLHFRFRYDEALLLYCNHDIAAFHVCGGHYTRPYMDLAEIDVNIQLLRD
jgi:hypothetical protein